MKLYAVYDAAANAFMPPLAFRAHTEAVRSFKHACVDPEHMFNKSLVDYSLWYIGEYNEASASLTLITPPECLAKGEEFKAALAGNS